MDAFREHCQDFRWPSSVIDGTRALLNRIQPASGEDATSAMESALKYHGSR